MKRITAIALLTLASSICAGTAMARDNRVQMTVPFDFTVGSKLLPANTYNIIQTSPSLVTIQSADRRFTATSISLANTGYSESRNRLLFTQYGDQHALRAILSPSANIRVDIPTTRLEKNDLLEQAKSNEGQHTLLASR